MAVMRVDVTPLQPAALQPPALQPPALLAALLAVVSMLIEIVASTWN